MKILYPKIKNISYKEKYLEDGSSLKIKCMIDIEREEVFSLQLK